MARTFFWLPQAKPEREGVSVIFRGGRDYDLCMKKAETRARKSSLKKTGSVKSVDQYLAKVPEPGRSTLNKVRAVIRAVAPPEATEVISYGIPGFKHKRMLVWYAAFADHCSLFPTAAVIEKFKEELKGFRTSKGTVHFPVDKPLPAALLKKLVKARIAENEAKPAR